MGKLSEVARTSPLAIAVLVSVLLVLTIGGIANRIDCSPSVSKKMVTHAHSEPASGGGSATNTSASSVASTAVGSKSGDSNVEQVKLLFDYTKFHIGVYFTLATLILSVLGSEVAKKRQLWLWSLGVAVVALVLAGMSGGVIASSLPHLFGSSDIQYEHIGPLNSQTWCLVTWTYLEHMAFWSAVVFAVVAFIPAMLGKKKETTPSEPLHVVLVPSSSAAPPQSAAPHPTTNVPAAD